MNKSDIFFEKANISNKSEIINFQLLLAKESEDLNLDEKVLAKGVAAVFNDHSKGSYYVAKYHGETIGCLLLLKEWSDWRNSSVLWIHSVYVRKEFRKQGVFRKMYLEVKDKVLNKVKKMQIKKNNAASTK